VLTKHGLVEALRDWMPDVIVSDFMSWSGFRASVELSVPHVSLVAGPVAVIETFVGLTPFSTAKPCCPWTTMACIPPDPGIIGFQCGATIGVEGLGILRREQTSMFLNSLVLFNSFIGVEPAKPLPSNVTLVGPLLPPTKSFGDALASNHTDLAAFLNGAAAGSAVYVTTGSMARLTQWQVEAIHGGLKSLGCPVVWSLKAELQPFLPGWPAGKEPIKSGLYEGMWLGSWLPQVELLSSEAVGVVITHCGWGGCLESISSAKPCVSIPFFGDQPGNAKLLQAAGVAEPIAPLPPFTSDEGANTYKAGAFTAASVAKVVGQVLSDPTYAAKARKLAALAAAAGGASLAADRIEYAAEHGIAHLTSADGSRGFGSSVARALRSLLPVLAILLLAWLLYYCELLKVRGVAPEG